MDLRANEEVCKEANRQGRVHYNFYGPRGFLAWCWIHNDPAIIRKKDGRQYCTLCNSIDREDVTFETPSEGWQDLHVFICTPSKPGNWLIDHMTVNPLIGNNRAKIGK